MGRFGGLGALPAILLSGGTRNTRLLLALLLLSTPAAAAPPPEPVAAGSAAAPAAAPPAKPVTASSPLELTLAFVPEQPRPGERVFWLGKLRNASKRKVYVPTRTSEWLHFFAVHIPPEGTGGSGRGYAFGQNEPPLEWQALAPGAVLEMGGALADEVSSCRRGCPAGDVQMTLEMAVPPKLSGESPDADHIVPRGLRAEAGVSIRVPTFPLLERTAADAVALTVLGVRAVRDGLRARLRLENRTDAPLWLPQPALWRATCAVTETLPGAWGAPGSHFGEEVRLATLAQAVLVRPGQAVTGEVACAGWQMPRRGTVAVTLAALEWADVRRAVSVPFVWSGFVESRAFEVGKKRL